MVKIFIFGITGKICKNIINFIKKNNNFLIIGGICKKNIFFLKKFKYNNLIKKLKKNGIIIDFSNSILLEQVLFFSRYYKIPIITGTTGFVKKQLEKIFFFSKKNPILISYNISIGINLINLILININNFLYKFNFNSFIIDIHHSKKKDFPSGTSLLLYSKIKKINIKIFSARIKKIIGNHIIYFISENEILKIEHTILNKNIFTIGLFYSIIWLLKKKKGIFTMYDIYFT